MFLTTFYHLIPPFYLFTCSIDSHCLFPSFSFPQYMFKHILKGYCCSASESADTVLARPPVGTKD